MRFVWCDWAWVAMYLLIYTGFCNRGFVLLFVSPCHYNRGKCWLEVGMYGMGRVRYLVVRVVCGEGPVIWMRDIQAIVFGFVIIVWYIGLIVKVGKSVRGIWWSMARGGVGDGDSGVCVGMDSMRIAAPYCNFVLYVGVSMCKMVLRECVTCIFAVFSDVTLLPGSLRPTFCVRARAVWRGCMERGRSFGPDILASLPRGAVVEWAALWECLRGARAMGLGGSAIV